MTNMENHVTNLETSKKLKELGVFYPCNYRWYRIHGYYGGTVEIDEFTLTSENNIVFDNSDKKVKKINRDGSLIEVQDNYNAYLATELLEILPFDLQDLENLDDWYLLEIFPLRKDKYFIHYRLNWDDSELTIAEVEADSLPNALGNLLVYLIENNIWKPYINNDQI